MTAGEDVVGASPILGDAQFAALFAPEGLRAAVFDLWRLQHRLAAVSANETEPHIPMIRLAWWRDTLRQLGDSEIAGEPLLEDLARTVPRRCFQSAGELAEAHMDRVEHGSDLPVFEALIGLGGSLFDIFRDGGGRIPPSLRPFTAPLASASVRHRSPTRRHLAIIGHIMRGKLDFAEGITGR